MQCPICGEDLKNTYSDVHEHGFIMESLDKCPNGHYGEYWYSGVDEYEVYGRVYTLDMFSDNFESNQKYLDRRIKHGKLRWKAEKFVRDTIKRFLH